MKLCAGRTHCGDRICSLLPLSRVAQTECRGGFDIPCRSRVWNPNAICAQLASSAFEEFTLAEKNRRDTARLGAFINFPSDDASLGEPGRNFSGSFQRTNTPSGLSRALSIDQRVRQITNGIHQRAATFPLPRIYVLYLCILRRTVCRLAVYQVNKTQIPFSGRLLVTELESRSHGRSPSTPTSPILETWSLRCKL